MSENPNPTRCGRCGTVNPPNAEVCGGCGAPLTMAAAAGALDGTPEAEDEPREYAGAGDQNPPDHIPPERRDPRSDEE